MKIYTGYFAQLNKYPNPIAISKWLPKEININRIIELAPSEELLKWYKEHINDKNVEQIYENNYRLSLSMKKITSQWIVDKCKEFRDEVTLLCYEKPDKFCHRHIITQILKENFKEIALGEYVLTF